MRISRMIVAALFIPAAAMTQVAPPATPSVKARLDLMESNVARIGLAGEKERWNANVSMWKIVFAKPGTLTAVDIQSLQTSLTTIRANIASLARSPERERWQANARLWQAFILGRPTPAATSPAAMPCCAQPGMAMSGMPGSMPMSGVRPVSDAAYGRMKLNVARIADSAEKERWSANCDLWEAVLAPAP